jgi:hypothetical protein
LVFQVFKFEPVVFAQVFRVEQPQLLAAGETVVSRLLQPLVLLAANLVDGFIEMFAQ